MNPHWTDSARTKLEEYFAKMRGRIAGSGADADEVAEDLRRHIDQEIAARKLAVVNEDDIGQILSRLGAPETATAVLEPAGPPAAGPAGGGVKKRRRPGWLLLIFGVVLPLGTVIFEYLSGACAAVLINPMPTMGHVLLTAFVPLANFAVWLVVRQERLEWRNRLGWVNGAAIGIALVYSLLFLPVTPFAIVGIAVYGFGLVPLAPLFSFLGALWLRHYLRRAPEPPVPLPGCWRGLALGAAALAVVTLPLIVTVLGIKMAASESPAQVNRGVSLLRSWGDREELLRVCYGRTGGASGLYSWRQPLSADAARNLYYRVTGRAFNTVPPPRLYAGRARWSVMEEGFTWDNDQGGDAVAGRVKGLSLASSRQDGFIDAGACLGYVEWTLEFRNESSLQREARAQIALPPGGVLSRLTLWIDGEEREAAFGGRSQVKSAYKAVVSQRRDPVLVTTAGPDRILMQCFPVPPNGGKMKVRLGITAPLSPASPGTGYFRWPHFIERNFTLRETFSHSLWMQSGLPIEAPGGKLKSEPGKPGDYALHGQAQDKELADPWAVMRVQLPPGSREAWTRETREEGGAIIRQSLVERPVAKPERVIIVVDGTEAMESNYRAISAALTKLPEGLDVALLVAKDGCRDWTPLQKGNQELYRSVALWKLQSRGGHDNVLALNRAWDLAAQSQGGVVVWIHGPQPILFDSAEDLRQRFERSSNSPRLIDVQTQEGPNRILEHLDGLKRVSSLLRVGDIGDDLGRLFSSWNGRSTTMEYVRTLAPLPSAENGPAGNSASMHVARLWAFEEVKRLIHERQPAEAARLAARYQLVTPVSGAVVLETKAQYQQAGLQPAAPDSVPAVPEPSVFLLIGLGLGILGLTRFYTRLRAERR